VNQWNRTRPQHRKENRELFLEMLRWLGCICDGSMAGSRTSRENPVDPSRARNYPVNANPTAFDDRNLPGLSSPEFNILEGAAEVRADPGNGKWYTREEMVLLNEGTYSRAEAEAYWDSDCRPVDRSVPPAPGEDWFSKLCSFREASYQDTRHWLKVEPGTGGGQMLVSRANGKSFGAGKFSTPRLDTLRAAVAKVNLPGKLTVRHNLGDVAEKHSHEANRHATFQVASQFNCLEFTHPRAVPEDGVTQYAQDRTQGPACSVACGAATIYRNFFVRMEEEGRPEQHGQTRDCMIDNLKDVSQLLGNTNDCLYTMAGGYSLSDSERVKKLNAALDRLEADGCTDLVRCALRIGVHDDVEVTAMNWGQTTLETPEQTVTQIFGSALAVGYNRRTTMPEDWRKFATLVLEASYEATLCAAILTAERHKGAHGSRRVFLTSLGGGVFGNPMDWIGGAIRRACERYKHYNLDVFIVTYGGEVHGALKKLEDEFS